MRAVVSAGPGLVMDGDGDEGFFAQITRLSDDPNAKTMVGLARPGISTQQPSIWQSPQFWGLSSFNAQMSHDGKTWGGSWPKRRCLLVAGDTLGLVLDCGAGTLTAYKNGEYMGVTAESLAGELCWAVAMSGGCMDVIQIEGCVPPTQSVAEHAGQAVEIEQLRAAQPKRYNRNAVAFAGKT